MNDDGVVRASVDLEVEPGAAFEATLEELAFSLDRRGIRLEAGPDGRVLQDGAPVGRILAWEPGERVEIEWRPATWEPERITRVEIRVERADGLSRVTVEQRGLAAVVGGDRELAGWFASEAATPLLAAIAPAGLGDWITDRQARRPSGPGSRATYRDPVYHYPNFHAILAELELTADDRLLEVGCGGGAFLGMALESGCRATGVDHSPDMIRVAREANREAIADGRLEIERASADALPVPDGAFTCAVMTGVLGFLPDPVAALAEIRRALAPGGRAMILGADPEDRGTPAAPEPMASRLRFYDGPQLEALGRAAGFESVRVVRRELEGHARRSGVPEEHVALFAGPGPRFLLVRKE